MHPEAQSSQLISSTVHLKLKARFKHYASDNLTPVQFDFTPAQKHLQKSQAIRQCSRQTWPSSTIMALPPCTEVESLASLVFPQHGIIHHCHQVRQPLAGLFARRAGKAGEHTTQMWCNCVCSTGLGINDTGCKAQLAANELCRNL